MTGSESFTEWFERATGNPPYAYQRALGEAERPPAVLEVPTGAGKTAALIGSWLYARTIRGAAPRRLVYALPMRSLVEQVASIASDIRRRLGLNEDELPIRVLMGGAERAELSDWRRWPDRDQILIGTIDMLLSRALNRGYAESRYQWPIAFGLLNSDCRWVFDEVQLMQAARTTSAQLAGLRCKLGVALPCETIWSSATVDRDALTTIDRPELGDVMQLPAQDREGPLAGRMNADKRLERVDLTGVKGAGMSRAIAERVAERHRAGTRSIVVLNRVQDAQEVARALKRSVKAEHDATTKPGVVLLHSRFRSPERRKHMDAALASVEDGPGTIVVATQVIEAGVNVSSSLLATDTAPFSSIVQRLGRCNRGGEERDAVVLWLDRGDQDSKRAAPYTPDDIAGTRKVLASLVGSSLSPIALEALRRDGGAPIEQAQERDVLRRRDLLDLFDTSPDLSGMDVDVARFIRDDDDRSVFVFFRDLCEHKHEQVAKQAEPARDELVSVPLGSLGERTHWIYDPIDKEWQSRRRASPGATVMLAGADGGYDPELGWEPRIRTQVSSYAPEDGATPEGHDDDRHTFDGEWMALGDHLDRAQAAAAELGNALGALDGDERFLRATALAAALHDIGKAHPAFQEMLRSSAKAGNEPVGLDTTIWAKSAARRGGRNERRHFRHELASALALRSLDGALPIPDDLRDLVGYLVAAHHGRVRLSIRPAPDERPPNGAGTRFALGVQEGDELPPVQTPLGSLPETTLTLACMELGGDEPSWAESACALRDDRHLGPFRLGFLEALVRVADWRASD